MLNELAHSPMTDARQRISDAIENWPEEAERRERYQRLVKKKEACKSEASGCAILVGSGENHHDKFVDNAQSKPISPMVIATECFMPDWHGPHSPLFRHGQ